MKMNKSIMTVLLACVVQVVFSQNDSLPALNMDSLGSNDNRIATHLLTQSDIETQNLIFVPKSPTVAGLAQAVDCPISYYTGTPEITIPLYTIPLRGYELPLTLSYHASGIKVAQEASWVGLGWNLSCVGMITRTVKCGDDFHEYGAGHDNGMDQGYYFAPEAKAPIDNSYFKSTTLGSNWLLVKDSEPDIFFYTIPGSSGKFLIDKSRGSVLLSSTGANHVQIKLHGKTISNNGFFTFEIVDTYGNRYFFDVKETTHTYNRNNELNMNYTLTNRACDEFEQRVSDLYDPSFDYTSSWLLTKIVTSRNQVITFEYEKENYQLPTQESVVKYNMTSTSGTGGNAISSAPQYSCSKTMMEGYHLARILWDAGSVSFSTSTREDIKTWAKEYPLMVPKKLDGICVKDKMGNTVKSYSFSYKYMNAGNTGSYAHVYKRLMLLSVKDDNDETFEYSMDYYAGDLPAKNSNDTDSWGYSNGIRQGANYYFPASYNGILYHGADKTPSLSHMRIGTLQKLRFPTGEENVFDYETPTSMTSSTVVSRKITASLGACYIDKVDEEEYENMPRTRTSTIKIDSYTVFEVSGYALNLLTGYSDLSYLYNNESYPVFRVYRIKKDGSKDENWCYSLTAPSEMINAQEACQYPSYNLGLPAGTYSFEVYSPIKDAYFAIYYTYIGTEVLPGKEIAIGGLRIKEILGTETRSFSYQGYNLLLPQTTSYVYNFQYFQDVSYNYSQTYLVQCSQPVTSMSTLKDGYAYGYNSVKESCGNSSVVYEYINDPEESLDDGYPFIPSVLNCQNGLLTRKTTYLGSTLKQIEEYGYDTFGNKQVFGFVQQPYESSVHAYVYDVGQPLLVSMKKSICYDKEIKEDEVFYSYNANEQLKEKRTNNSVGSYITKYFYPSDKEDDLYKKMTEANIIGIPIECQNFLGGEVISATNTEYGKFFDFYMACAQYKSEINNPIDASILKNVYVKRNEIRVFSSLGNPREVVTDGNSMIFIWAYSGMYPIAQIKNCTYSALTQYLSESTLDMIESKYQPTESDWVEVEKLRETFPEAEVVTLEYKPYFGIIRQTDQRGFSTYFTYDNVGRLAEEFFYENGKKMILKKHSYHYQTK